MENPVKKYWDDKIKIWSETSYEKNKKSSFITSIFSKLRKSIDARKETAVNVLEPYIKDKSILDIGCGVGVLGIDLLSKGCAKYIGLDISEIAVEEGRRRAEVAGLSDKMEFICSRLQDIEEFPNADITVALGLLDWITLSEVEGLIKKLKGRKILLTFSEQDNSLNEIIHRFYLVKRLQWKNKGVYAHHFYRSDVDAILKRNGFENIKYIKNNAMRFGVIFHNLDEK